MGSPPLVIGGALVVCVSIAAVRDRVARCGPLVGFRLLGGIGEAAFFVGAATMITDLAPIERRGEAISYWSDRGVQRARLRSRDRRGGATAPGASTRCGSSARSAPGAAAVARAVHTRDPARRGAAGGPAPAAPRRDRPRHHDVPRSDRPRRLHRVPQALRRDGGHPRRRRVLPALRLPRARDPHLRRTAARSARAAAGRTLALGGAAARDDRDRGVADGGGADRRAPRSSPSGWR